MYSARLLPFASRKYVQAQGAPAEPEDLASHRCTGSGRWTLSKGRKIVTPDLTFQVLTHDPLVHPQLVLDEAVRVLLRSSDSAS